MPHNVRENIFWIMGWACVIAGAIIMCIGVVA
jgi:hypothetical protein